MQRQDTHIGEKKHVRLTPIAVMKIKKELLKIINQTDNKTAIEKSIADVPAYISQLKVFVPLCMGYKGSPTAALLRDYHASLVKEMHGIMQDKAVEIQFFVHFPTRKEADDFLVENPDLRSFCMSIEDFHETQKWQSLNESRKKLSVRYAKDWQEKLDKSCADFEKKLIKQGVPYNKAESEVYFSGIAGDWAAMMPSEPGEVSLVLSDRQHDHLPVWTFVNRHAHEMRWKAEYDRRTSADLSSLSDASSMSSDDSVNANIDSDSEGTRRIYKDNFRYVQFTVEAIPQLQNRMPLSTVSNAGAPLSPTLEDRVHHRTPSAPIGISPPSGQHPFKFFTPQKSFVPAGRVSNDSGYLSTVSNSSSSSASSSGSGISTGGSNPSSDDEAIGIITENFGIAIAEMAKASVEQAAELYHASCKLMSTRVSSSSIFQHPTPAINAGFRNSSAPSSPSPSTSPKQ